MSNLSIFDNRWTELVFEGKNQEYGAFQLRKENSRTSIIAFLSGISLMAVLFGSFMVFSSFTTPAPIPEPENIHGPIIVNFEPRKQPKEKKPEIKVKEQQSVPKEKIDKKDLKNIVLVDQKLATDIIKTKTDPVTSTNPNIGDGKPTGNPTLNPIPTSGGNGGGSDPEGPKKPVGPVTTGELDKMPTFPGGIDKFREFVGNNFQKPDFDEEKTVTVYVSFVIELDGSLSNIKVLKDPGYGLGKEAIRVLNSLKTKWTAGILDGEKVRTTYTLPIAIQMQ